MKNTIINSLGYAGTVTLSKYTKGKKIELAKIHNRGNNHLFEFLADCLIGDYDNAKYNRPTKLLLLNYNNSPDGGNELESASTGFIYLYTKPEKVTTLSSCVVRYSFIVHRDNFNSSSVNALGLYSNANTDVYDYSALCLLKDEERLAISTATDSTALVIDWELTIFNA